jgi:hypothetical protein
MSDLLFQYVHKETKNIELTAADYEQIAAELRAGNKY